MPDNSEETRHSPGGAEGGLSRLAAALVAQIRKNGPLSFADYMEAALYAPGDGYYRRQRKRIGSAAGTDFVTAYTEGSVFAGLVAEAAARLVGEDKPSTYTLVELGVEPEGALWNEAPHPFGAWRPIGRGDPMEISGKAVVFSNELFDAQPFHRLRFNGGVWREVGVGIEDGRLCEMFLPAMTEKVAAVRDDLPASVSEGYTLDLSLGATALLENILAQQWEGVFLAFDYGKRRETLYSECPEGTVRAYSRHRQRLDLFSRPGEMDITGHICWDGMETLLARHGFRDIRLMSQEAFFVNFAASEMERIIRRNPGLPDPDRRRLQQLIHPGNMGQKFQVLSGKRP